MSNLRNPVSNLANVAIKRNIWHLQRNSKELATGVANNQRNLAAFVVGSSLRSTESVIKKVQTSSNYGINLLRVAQNTIISIKDMLLEMRTIIAQANTSFGTNLKQLDDIYKEKANRILDMLISTQFEGRNLFDGSLANFGVQIPAQLIPNSAAPLNIRVDENINNIISLSIPRLLTGDGTIPDGSVPGRFTPLFPTTDDAAKATVATNLVNSANPNMTSAQAINNIDAAIPDTFGVNPIQDNIRNIALNAAQTFAQNEILNGVADDALLAARTKAVAVAAAIRASGANQDAIDALALVNDTYSAFPLDIFNHTMAIPLPGTQLGDLIINTAKNALVGFPGGIFGGQNAVFVKARAMNAAITTALTAGALNTSIGNLLTNDSQKVADGLVTSAIDIVSLLISNTIGQLDNLLNAENDIDSLVTVLNAGAESYLSTKYEDAAKESSNYLLALQGNISTIAQAYKIADATLELIKNNY